jgi:hypothetical protein
MRSTRRDLVASSGLLTLAAVGRSLPALAEQASPGVQTPGASQLVPSQEQN